MFSDVILPCSLEAESTHPLPRSVGTSTLPQAIGEFVLTDPNMRIKPRGKIYSLNEGYANKWDDAIREYVNSKKQGPVSAHCGICIFFFCGRPYKDTLADGTMYLWVWEGDVFLTT